MKPPLAKVETLKMVTNHPVNLNTVNLLKPQFPNDEQKEKKNHMKYLKEDKGTRIYYC